MFSSNSLVQFVFANKKDTYFWGGLFKTDLERYIWFELHDKYRTVYFIDNGDSGITVSHLQEKVTEQFKAKAMFSSPEAQLAKWIRKRLEDKKNNCAVVFPLESFCDIFRNEGKLLGEIRESQKNGFITGTIVLVASTDAEHCKKILLNSPVFNYLDERAVLNLRSEDNIESIFSLLKNSKQESCVFLNIFTRELIAKVILQVIIESPGRFRSGAELENMAAYLSGYLNSVDMQMNQKALFRNDFSLVNPLYRDIYNQLKDEQIWNRIRDRSKDFRDNSFPQTENRPMQLSRNLRITFNDDTVEMRCLKLCTPGAIYTIYNDKTVNNLCKIYNEILAPCNKQKDSDVEKKIDSLLIKLDNAKQNNDSDTCSRIVTAILFCVKWLHVEPEYKNDVMKIIEIFFQYEQISTYHFTLKKDYDSTAFYGDSIAKKIENYRLALQNMDNFISVQITNLTLSGARLMVSDMFENMQHIMDELDMANKKHAEPEASTPKSISDDFFRFDVP